MSPSEEPTSHFLKAPLGAIEALLSGAANAEQILLALEWAVGEGAGACVSLTPKDEESAAWAAILLALQMPAPHRPEVELTARWSGASSSSYRESLERAALGGGKPERMESPNLWIEATPTTPGLNFPRHRRSVETALNAYVAERWGARRNEPLSMPLTEFARASALLLPPAPGPKTQLMLSEALSRLWEKARLEAATPSAAPRGSKPMAKKAL